MSKKPIKLSITAPIFVPLKKKSPQVKKNNFHITSFNILSTHRMEDVRETQVMYTKRYNIIIDNLLSPNFRSTFFLLQEVDEHFVHLLRQKESIYQIVGPHYFNNRADKIGTLILIDKEICRLKGNYTNQCQFLYRNIYKNPVIPFRGQCIHVEYLGIEMIICTIHHSKQPSDDSIDEQLQNTLKCIINDLHNRRLLHLPIVIGGDFYYPGELISTYLNNLIKQSIFQHVEIYPLKTSSHKYIKKDRNIKIMSSSSTADQIIYSNLRLDDLKLHPETGISYDVDNHPYIYPNLPELTQYELTDFDQYRRENEPSNTSGSDHVMVKTIFNFDHLFPARGFGKNRKSKKNKKSKKTKKNRKNKKSGKNKKSRKKSSRK